MYECEICGFRSMNKKSLDEHMKEKHSGNEDIEKEKIPKLANRPLNKVKIGLVSGMIISGEVETVTKYEIVINSEGTEYIVFKGSIEYVERVD
ncbi:MAG: C2H2-type zinc finger protein [Petrotogales bacterium]